MSNGLQYIFGGPKAWDSGLWTASDDRVRGGSSISHLYTHPTQAKFYGHLDTKTLGGAGFASQRTVGDLALDLSCTEGIKLSLGWDSSDQTFTLNVKDTIPGKREDGRDEAGVSWEYDFKAPENGGEIFMKWDEFKATFFDKQDGDFKLYVDWIAAVKKDDDDSDDDGDLKKHALEQRSDPRPVWKRLFCGLL
ncbi:complex i intermediate-associated 30 [Fusarium sp. NRRL 25303]|nr:complex i intermediate-associated 30 [Fusarium sp. NRRL 25303]